MAREKASKSDIGKKVPRRKQYSAPALEKGLDILELLAREPEPINLKEIAERLGRSVGEIFRMLAVLEQRGYVQTIDESERYRLSMQLFRLAHWHLPINRLTSVASGPMQRLALQTGQSCHLTILSGVRVVVVARQDSFKDRSFAMRIGAESPLLASCSGRIFYASAEPTMREALVGRLKEEGAYRPELDKVDEIAGVLDRTKILEMPSAQIEGIVDIGTPIIDHDGSVVAALVVPFLHTIDEDNKSELGLVRASLLSAAREISKALGFAE